MGSLGTDLANGDSSSTWPSEVVGHGEGSMTTILVTLVGSQRASFVRVNCA